VVTGKILCLLANESLEAALGTGSGERVVDPKHLGILYSNVELRDNIILLYY
jgi:hypothetical protein